MTSLYRPTLAFAFTIAACTTTIVIATLSMLNVIDMTFGHFVILLLAMFGGLFVLRRTGDTSGLS